jgi:hypothetical protein
MNISKKCRDISVGLIYLPRFIVENMFTPDFSGRSQLWIEDMLLLKAILGIV